MIWLYSFWLQQQPYARQRLHVFNSRKQEKWRITKHDRSARRNRAKKFQEIDDEVVYIKKDIYKEIESVMARKCRLFTNYWNIVTKEKATYLLKKSARLG